MPLCAAVLHLLTAVPRKDKQLRLQTICAKYFLTSPTAFLEFLLTASMYITRSNIIKGVRWDTEKTVGLIIWIGDIQFAEDRHRTYLIREAELGDLVLWVQES